MKQLHLPIHPLKIKNFNNQKLVFDRVRKKFVSLTPEEWVRQNFINFLIEDKEYPESLIANEMEISLFGLSRRCDSVVYSREAKPLMILEFKATSVPITQKVFEQIAAYNLKLNVNYLIISNGIKHYCMELNSESGKASILKEIPFYKDLK